MRRLPDDVKREVNRLAHALAQWSYAEHRRRLEAQALALLRGGIQPGEVIGKLAAKAEADRENGTVRAGAPSRA
jgi:hypothetical protein